MSVTQHAGLDVASEAPVTPAAVPWTHRYVRRVFLHDLVVVVRWIKNDAALNEFLGRVIGALTEPV